MIVREHVQLREMNTLRLAAEARWFIEACSTDELRDALRFCRQRALPLLVLGGGSNIVLTGGFDGCVLRIALQGEQAARESASSVELRVGAGVCWHSLVMSTHERGWHGLENLALIPGTVGAAPIQNIGAYGVEVSRFVVGVEAMRRDSGEIAELEPAECGFAYRHSRFKERDDLVVSALRLRLSRDAAPEHAYPVLRDELCDRARPTHADVLRAVMAIRRRRLPDPAVLPNAGSFFKNPVIDEARFTSLLARHPDVVHWPQAGGHKLAAAWLVDQCGWKEYREGDVGVHREQALVLVNHGTASAGQVLALAQKIATSVRERFGVELELEPAVY